jgi:hypothetical protein
MPSLIPDPAPAEQKQEAPPMRREGAPPPVGMAASASAPPDEMFLEEAAATAQPQEQHLTDERCLFLKELGRREIVEFLDSYGQYKRGCDITPVPLSLFVQRDLLSAIAKYEFGLDSPEELTDGDLERYLRGCLQPPRTRGGDQGARRYGAAAAASRHMPCARCSARHQTRECPVPWAQPHTLAMADQSCRGCFGCGGNHDIGDCYVVDHCLQSKGWAQRYRRQICYGCGGPHHLKRCRLSPATKDVIWAKVRLQCVFRTWRMFIHGAAGGEHASRRPA